AAVGLGVLADSEWQRVGLVAAGVFGLLAAVSSAAALPAIGAVAVGGWLAVLPTLAGGIRFIVPGRGDAAPGRALVAAALLSGVVCSLSGAAGVDPGHLRPAGTAIALVGLAVSPLALPSPPRSSSLVFGGVIAGTTLLAGTAAPFVTGAVALVVAGIVHVPFALVVVGAGGAGISVADAARRGDGATATAAALLVVAGVPYTLPRALAVVVAATLVAEGSRTKAGGCERTRLGGETP
ncbi:MAG: hypothetical protein ABEJ28_06100, partial [Salinigranum sp.]